MNSKKKAIVTVVSVVLIAVISVSAFSILSKKKGKKVAKNPDIIVDANEEDKIEEVKPVGKPQDILLFNAKAKEIALYSEDKGIDNHKSLFINGNKLGETKEPHGKMEGLVPYKIDGRLFFADLDFNSIIEVTVSNKEVYTDVVINSESVDVKNIKELSVVENIMYLTLGSKADNVNEKEPIKNDIKIVEINLKTKESKEYKMSATPSNLFKINGEFFYMDNHFLVKARENAGIITETKRVELGDKLSDFRIEGNSLYALSEFGKREENSVLMRVNLEALEVKDIMSLRGLDSTFIGMENDIAYVSQKDGIKEIDIIAFEPLRAFNSGESKSAQYSKDSLYSLVDEELQKITTDALEIESNTKTNFNDFYIVKESLRTPVKTETQIETEPKTETEIETETKDTKEIKPETKKKDIEKEAKEEKKEKTEIDFLKEAVKGKIKNDYKSKEGKDLSDEDLDKITNQIMQNDSVWESLSESITEGVTELND